jgi:hypothetical protein
MAARKRRTTITLDPAVVEVLGDDAEALSAAVNEVLHTEIERRQRAVVLDRLLEGLAAQRGAVDAAEVDEVRRVGVGAVVVLGPEAVAALIRGGEQERIVRATLTVAREESTEVVVPAAALAELYRGVAQDQAVDGCLGTVGGVAVVATDRPLARRIGKILADAGSDAADHALASLVAVCAAAGGGLILTGDPKKVSELCSGSPTIVVRGIGVKWRPALFGTHAAGSPPPTSAGVSP